MSRILGAFTACRRVGVRVDVKMQHRVCQMGFGGKRHPPHVPVLTRVRELDLQEIFGRVVGILPAAVLRFEAVFQDGVETINEFRIGAEDFFVAV